MPWRDAQALHIFVPASQSMENWVEQVLGTVVRPLYEKFGMSIRWMWVTRYIQPFERLPHQIQEDSKRDSIPDNFLSGPNFRYVVFRISVEEAQKATLQEDAIKLAQKAGFYVAPWVDYSVVEDLGMDRFIHEEADEDKRAIRAHLVANFVDATVKLMLHSLIAEDGQWKLEPNTHEQNPDGSFFQSMHHLFCNATNVPTFVEVYIGPAKYPIPIKYPVQF